MRSSVEFLAIKNLLICHPEKISRITGRRFSNNTIQSRSNKRTDGYSKKGTPKKFTFFQALIKIFSAYEQMVGKNVPAFKKFRVVKMPPKYLICDGE